MIVNKVNVNRNREGTRWKGRVTIASHVKWGKGNPIYAIKKIDYYEISKIIGIKSNYVTIRYFFQSLK